MNNYAEFQVNIFSNNRDIRLHLENCESKKGHRLVKKIGGLPPLLVNFSNNRDIRKCQSFRMTADNDDDDSAADNDARAMTISGRFL